MLCGGKLGCKCLKDLDIFGKNVDLFYKGKDKKNTYFGSILTIIYGIIYLAFLLYKLIRMLKKKDITFYDTFSYLDEPPIINITNENFYGGFALEDPNTYDPFIDETIYIPKAYFKIAKRNGSEWDWKIKEIELERCNINKFGSFYKDKFENKALDTLYCFKEVNDQFIGHFSYDYYSFFFIEFYPCINTTENKNICKTKEIIDYYLKSTFVSLQLQDIELTPLNYQIPARAKDQDIYTTIGKKLFQEIHIYFQIVNIETDLDILGFTDFEQVRIQKYLKYDSSIQMTSLIENDIYESGESFCDITIKLTDKVLTERRRYTKLTEVLRDVGGFTEVILSIFYVLSSFSIKILYDLSLVNNLFEFDINKKLILIKKYQNNFVENDEKNNNNIFEPLKVFTPKNSNNKINYKAAIINDDISSHSKNRLNIENLITKNKLSNDIISPLKTKKLKRNKKVKYTQNNNENNDNKEMTINDLNIKREKKHKTSKRKKEKKLENNENIYGNDIKKEKKIEKDEDKKYLIDKIKINKICIYLCFLCVRKRKKLDNILLKEGKKIIIEKLDIRNIFKKLYKDDEHLNDQKTINMSETCINSLQAIDKIKN